MAVPPEIKEAIKAFAAKEWPGDFKMQVYVINEQMEAYEKIEILKRENRAGGDIFRTCLQKATSEWADDFNMQLYELNQQIESAIEFEKYVDPSIPEKIFLEMKNRAWEEWSDDNDFNMMLYELKEQISAWKELRNI